MGALWQQMKFLEMHVLQKVIIEWRFLMIRDDYIPDDPWLQPNDYWWMLMMIPLMTIVDAYFLKHLY